MKSDCNKCIFNPDYCNPDHFDMINDCIDYSTKLNNQYSVVYPISRWNNQSKSRKRHIRDNLTNYVICEEVKAFTWERDDNYINHVTCKKCFKKLEKIEEMKKLNNKEIPLRVSKDRGIYCYVEYTLRGF